MSLSYMRLGNGLILNEAATLDTSSDNTLEALCDFAKKSSKLLEPYTESYTILDAIDHVSKILNDFLTFTISCDNYIKPLERYIKEEDLVGEEKMYLKEFIGKKYSDLPVIRHSKIFITKGQKLAYENLDAYTDTRLNNKIFGIDSLRDTFRGYYKSILKNELDGDCIEVTHTSYWNEAGVSIKTSLEFLKFISDYDRVKRFETTYSHSMTLRENYKWAANRSCDDAYDQSKADSTVVNTHIRIRFLLSEINRLKLEILETESIDKVESELYKLVCSTVNLIAAFCFPIGYALYEVRNYETTNKALSDKMEEIAAKYAAGTL